MNPKINELLPIAVDVLVWAIVIHLVFDWLLQTDWMARNKSNLRHPAAYIHSGLHALGLLLIFPWYLALAVGFTHLLIDTRKTVTWWIEKIKKMPPSTPIFSQVEVWMDQIFHGLILVAAVLVLPVLTS